MNLFTVWTQTGREKSSILSYHSSAATYREAETEAMKYTCGDSAGGTMSCGKPFSLFWAWVKAFFILSLVFPVGSKSWKRQFLKTDLNRS
jgi:hypothetical protein